MIRPTALFAFCCAWLMSLTAFAQDLPASADTWVDGSASAHTLNFDRSKTIRARRSGNRFALVRFAQGQVPPGDATLLVVLEKVNVEGEVQVRMVTSPWTSSTVTFDTRPSLASSTLSTRRISGLELGQVLAFDVSAAVAAWRNDPSSNNGLAITATGSTAEVYFVSREGGSPPRLHSVLPPVEADNDVTVSKVGGDYSDPVVAIENALGGDTWCVSRSVQAPCTLRIAAGVYPLSQRLDVPELIDILGADRSQTILIGKPGVDQGMQVRGSSIRDLTVINDQPDRPGTVAISFSSLFGLPLLLDHVIARAGSQTSAIALLAHSPERGGITIADSELTAIGGGGPFPVKAMDLFDNDNETTIIRSRLIATSDFSSIGLEWRSDRGIGATRLVDTSVIASATNVALGVATSSRDVVLELTNGEVLAFGDQSEAVLLSGLRANLSMTNVKVVAHGVERGIGVLSQFSGPDLLLNGVSIDATTNGAILGNAAPGGSPALLRILRSHLVAARALEVSISSGFPATVELSHSHLRGAMAVMLFSDGQGTFNAEASILAGQFTTAPGVTARCEQVFDATLRILRPDCAPP